MNTLNLGYIHQAWLLSGTRGVGKTTIARILAKNLNCKEKITAFSCDKCINCINIEKGKFIDFVELDAASKTKVEDIKILLEGVKYSPVIGRFKIYLIDEVHMLSRYSFNALLKTLEEPPRYVKFIFATTELEKVPKTIVSRCLNLKLKPIISKDIYKQLKYIFKKENINIDLEILKIISKTAEGSMRDALNISELVISSVRTRNIKITDVNKLLGILPKEKVFLLAKYLVQGNAKIVFFILQKIEALEIENIKIIHALIFFLHKILILKIVPSFLKKNQKSNNIYQKKINLLARRISFTNIKICYKILITSQKYLKYLPNTKIGIEMIFLKIFYSLKKNKF